MNEIERGSKVGSRAGWIGFVPFVCNAQLSDDNPAGSTKSVGVVELNDTEEGAMSSVDRGMRKDATDTKGRSSVSAGCAVLFLSSSLPAALSAFVFLVAAALPPFAPLLGDMGSSTTKLSSGTHTSRCSTTTLTMPVSMATTASRPTPNSTSAAHRTAAVVSVAPLSTGCHVEVGGEVVGVAVRRVKVKRVS